MLDITSKLKEKIPILAKLSPALSFITVFLVLYSLFPRSFVGDPTWEGNWQGRFFYLFFLWIFFLEMILNWEKLQINRVNKPTIRTITFIIALLLPTVYVIIANYYGLNTIIVKLAEQNDVPLAQLIPLSIEYVVLAVLFNLILWLEYGTRGLLDFSISALFLVVVGILYMVDCLYPYGRFTLFQFIVPTTAKFAESVLRFMGYQTQMRVTTSAFYGLVPDLLVWIPQNPLKRARFAIAWPCSGVESLIIYTVTILIFLKKTPISWKHRAIYFVTGALVTYFINILRIVNVFVIAINGGDWLRFHNLYGQLYSIAWIVSYPLIIIGTRRLWHKLHDKKVE